MKKLILIVLILLLAGTFLGEWIAKDPGYVLLSYQDTTVETSLWGLLMVALAAFLGFHFLLRVLLNLRLPGKKFQHWGSARGRSQANRKTLKGLLALSSGDWSKAQRFLTDAADKTDIPLINYLAAARAAQEQHQHETCDTLLQKARESASNSELAVGITQAQVQLSRGQLEPCLATLLRLRKLAPKHTYLLKLLKTVYWELKDWQGLAQLLPELTKRHVLKEGELRELEHQTYLKLLEQAQNSQPIEADSATRLKELNRVWKSLPRVLNKDPKLITAYAELLVKSDAAPEAVKLLKSSLKQEWNPALIRLYGCIKGADPHKQLQQASLWKKEHSEDPALLLTLGRLSLMNSEWEKAREYFEASLEREKSQESYNELARLLQHLGQPEKHPLLKESLNLLAQDLPRLPMPEAVLNVQEQS
jgi:HemY protein